MRGRWSRAVTNGSVHRTSDFPSYVALGLIAVSSIGLAYLALSGVHLGARPTTAPALDSTPSSVIAPTPTATPTPTADGAVVGLVSDGVPAWWSGSVDAGVMPGLEPGLRISLNGANISALTAQVSSTEIAPGQVMVVQAGSQDIIDGASAVQIDVAIQALWTQVEDRGGRPIAALIPPSDTYPGSVVAVNELIRAAALTRGVAVLDVNTVVGTADGAWDPDFSDDGEQPNAAGTSVIVESVVLQLPALVADAPQSG